MHLVSARGIVFVVLAAGCGGPSRAAPAADAGVEAAADVPAPRPVAPISVSYVTTQRPTFSWSLPAGADGAQVDVCADRACSRVVTSFAAAGTSGAPAQDLPAGVVFWRLHGTHAGVAGATTSATWELVVPPVSASVATAWGAMLDADGDGYGDVVVGDSDAFTATSHVYVHRGGPGGPSAAPSTILSAPSPIIGYAASIASAGDVDGDGYADLVVGSPGADTAYLYLGGPAGFADPPAATLTGPAGSQLGASVSGAGDVDGDGYGDVVVGMPALSPPGVAVVGGATVYRGGPGGLSPSRASTLAPRGTSNAQGFGSFVATAGDVNADGLADVAVWGGIETVDPQYVLVYLGSTLLYGTPGLLLQYDGASASWLGAANLVACAGDVNGDGFADLAVAAPTAPGGFSYDHVALFFGGQQGLAIAPSRDLLKPLAAADHFGLSVAGVDLDQDGLSDLAATSASYAQPPVATLVYAGGSSGPSLATTITTNDATTRLEREVGSPGDVNGDGYPDLVVGFPSRATASSLPSADGGPSALHGAVEIHAGGPKGASAAARWTLLPPDSSAVAYGATLARP
jgi:hypothetical protein